MQIQTNWYVITGGPSSGKSKTIDHLAFLGYQILPEAARVLIDNEKSKGNTLDEIRKDEDAFQKSVLSLKLEAEARLNPASTVFLDRGVPDSIAYCRLHGFGIAAAIHASDVRRYRGIFLLDMLPYEEDYARVEDEATALRLQGLLHDAYAQLGYEVVRVPKMPIDQRSAFILEAMK